MLVESPSVVEVRLMRASNAIIGLLKQRYPFRSAAYLDAQGTPTIGHRHQFQVSPGQVVSEETAETMLREDVHHCTAVLRLMPGLALEQHQFDALAALIMDVGMARFARSKLRYHLMSRMRTLAADEFLMFTTPDKAFHDEHVRRRRTERFLFETAVYLVK